MYDNYTDAENTGAPLVPSLGAETGDQTRFSEHEEAVLSHRIET